MFDCFLTVSSFTYNYDVNVCQCDIIAELLFLALLIIIVMHHQKIRNMQKRHDMLINKERKSCIIIHNLKASMLMKLKEHD